MAKSLSGLGLPFALTLIKPEYDRWKPGEHNGTFRGNNHAFVTATRALELYWSDEKFEAEVTRKAALLGERLAAMAANSAVVRRVKGRGMMQGVEIESGELADAICSACFAAGLVIETSGARGEVVKVLCPLTIEDGELKRGLEILEGAIAKIEAKTENIAA
jgi:diaminobutyrate-2-oxoglutarate transaminase